MHSFRRHGYAAGRRRQAGAGDVQEDGAAGAWDRRSQIVIQDDDDVVQVVVTPEALVPAPIGQADRTIVAAVAGIVAPAVVDT